MDRRSFLGASDAPAVLGLSPWRTAWEVWAEKTGRIDSWTGNAATSAGQLLEPAVLAWAARGAAAPARPGRRAGPARAYRGHTDPHAPRRARAARRLTRRGQDHRHRGAGIGRVGRGWH
ncbi:MAG: hypothetical protein KatS3mg038_1259 [Candidatus Kapaibacterium sp.]|nr:MAG: hypothetical protein KatS3mg038_1259 [Candidatus Kapabacteria bacterium]